MPQVRLVGDNIPEPGIYPIAKARALADELELDLVEISDKADPHVCKILDYQKYLYQQRKRAKEIKANAAKIVIKEIRFGPNTDEHDFQFKLKHAQEFLQEGSKVKASIFFRGRSIMFARTRREHAGPGRQADVDDDRSFEKEINRGERGMCIIKIC